MAMYESDTSTVVAALTGSGSPVFSDSTIETILQLTTGSPTGGGGGGTPGGGTPQIGIDQVTATEGGTVTVPAGTDLVFIKGSDTIQTAFNAPGDVGVIVFQGNGGVDVIINGGSNTGGGDSSTDRVVIGSGGNDKIVIADGKDTTVILGTGDSTVVGGLGNDSITGGLGNSTVSGGGGHDMLHLGGHASDYTTHVGTIATAAIGQPQDEVTTHVIITNTSTGFTTDLTGIQYVQLDGADALIFADSTVEAGVAALYHAAFDRTGEFGGVEYWFDKATAGATLASIAADFTHSAEFAADAALSDTEFITKIYLNTFDRGPDAGGLVYWEQQLQGGATRADLLAAFASVAALNAAGVLHTEATIVGSVTVVQHIV